MTAAHAMSPVRNAVAEGRNGRQANPLLDLVTSAPALPQGMVRRPALVQTLADAERVALALIVGPPGYGKSALLAEWAECDERPFAWLALGHPGHRAISALTARRSVRASEGMADLVRRIRARRAGFVLVLDDAHLLPPSVLRSVVEVALEELPTGSTLVAASRVEPALAIGRLRAHRRLGEIDVQQLAMSSAEAAVLFRTAGLELESDHVEALVQRTEGWPAALYLAALALRLDPGSAATFGGRHHLLSGYLRDEVFAALPADLMAFAVTTSVLEELSGPVCDAAIDGQGSARVIERLARRSALLVPVDAEHKSYRWHTLMREALQGELQRLEPELERVARLRASRWYAGHGDTESAIEQAAAAGDAELTGELLWRRVLACLNYGQNDLVAGWLARFSTDRISECPPLALSAALSALTSGNVREARRWSLVAEAAIERQSGVQWPASLLTGLS
ncbi:MAG: hypothetical protein JOZ73_14430, partial [Solirubrobacterales bacterium]|nr:hypothetical protein [Solirubrobacterales bacterium]